MPRKRFDAYESPVVLRVCDLFLSGSPAADVARAITKEVGIRFSREEIYPILAEARRRGFLHLVPPVERRLAERLAQVFGLDPTRITVVNAPEMPDSEPLIETGARLGVGIIRELGERGRRPVHLGLGPGRVSRNLARCLGRVLAKEPLVPQVSLHAITSGCPSRLAEYSPLAFFNFFEPASVKSTFGFFTEAVVPCRDYEQIRQRRGFREALDHSRDIDVVFTSLGAADDDHDLFKTLLDAETPAAIRHLEALGWCGNLQYRPYSAVGPIQEGPDAVRVPTIFELQDLKALAERRSKHVILFVHPCGICGKVRTEALLPLLRVPELKVWSEIVIDVRSARDVLLAVESGPA